MSKQSDFIAMVAPGAQRCQLRMSVLASLTIAQAILESGWGTSELATKANNLFGIKGDHNGESYTIKTSEWDENKKEYYTIDAAFRKYPSVQDSIMDHGEFLQKPRYAKVLQAKYYKDATREVKAAGYATSPTYTESLDRIIEQYELYKYDDIIVCPDCGKPVPKRPNCVQCGKPIGGVK